MKFTSLKAKLSATALLFGMAWSVQAQELRFSWWGGGERHEATLKLIELYKSKNPGVNIKAEYGGFAGYLERLTTQVAGGTEPDIMQINWAWQYAFSKNGEGFYDMNKSRSQIKFSDFSADEIASGTIKGKLNSLSAGFTSRVFLWNKPALAKAGLRTPRSWDELFASAKVFRAKNGQDSWIMDGNPYDMILLSQTYIYQKYGVPYIDPENPKVAMTPEIVAEWVKFYKRLYDEGVAVPVPTRASLGGVSKPIEQQSDWVNGKWGGAYLWNSNIGLTASTLTGKVNDLELGEFLTLQGNKNSGLFGRSSLGFAVSKNSKNPEAAVKFLNFMLTSPEAAAVLGLSRGIPASDTHTDYLIKNSKLDGLELRAHRQVKAYRDKTNITLPSPLFEHPRMRKLMDDVFEKVAYGKMSEVEAARQLHDQGNSILQRIK